jgi:hypothetical protein
MEGKRYVSVAELARIGVPDDFDDPLLFVFKMVSDNGANMKAAWNNGSRWVPCADHTLELCTLPVTWVQKHQGNETIPRDSIAEAFAHGRGIVGYLHVSPIAEADFHACQKRCGLPQTKIDMDVKTRWRTAHNMGEQLIENKPAILEMDKNPAYKDPGETWGSSKISMGMWDFIEEGTAVLDKAAEASQFLEGDKYPTSSGVIPMTFALMATSAPAEPVKFRNRIEDDLNDSALNPEKVPHADLTSKMQTARKQFHESLITRFDSDVPRDVKKFWFIASLLDPRFKKLTFKNDRLLTDMMRTRALSWLKAEFDRNYKGKVKVTPSDASHDGPPDASHDGPRPSHRKRRKTSAAGFFAGSDSESEEEQERPLDELEAYLALPQIKFKTESDATAWWQEHEQEFPNVAVMARQYLGCPASSAAVERLFSQVGIAFSAKRKRGSAATLEDIMFSRFNLP